MNYIDQINGFWDKAESKDLTGNDIAVYFALLNYNNRLMWMDTFVCHWDIVCQTAGISKNTYYKCMERLNDAGFIEFESGIRNVSKPKVSVLKFENRTGTEREQKGNRKGTEREQKGNIYKHRNLQTDKPVNHKTFSDKSRFDEFYLPYPNKKAKGDAEKAWAKLTAEEKEKAIEVLPNHILYWNLENKQQFIPHPSTWLNQKRWEDVIETKAGTTTTNAGEKLLKELRYWVYEKYKGVPWQDLTNGQRHDVYPFALEQVNTGEKMFVVCTPEKVRAIKSEGQYKELSACERI